MKYQLKRPVACRPHNLRHLRARVRAACAKEAHEAYEISLENSAEP
jgi:hypothetical protein